MLRLFKRNAITPLIPPKIKFKKVSRLLPAGRPAEPTSPFVSENTFRFNEKSGNP